MKLFKVLKSDKKVGVFRDFLSNNSDYVDTYFKMGIDGESDLFKAFVRSFVRKKVALEHFFEIRTLLFEKDRYFDFMKSFHELMTRTQCFEDMNIEGEDRRHLMKIHEKY